MNVDRIDVIVGSRGQQMAISIEQFIQYCATHQLNAKTPDPHDEEWENVAMIGFEGDVQDPKIYLDSTGQVYAINHAGNENTDASLRKIDDATILG